MYTEPLFFMWRPDFQRVVHNVLPWSIVLAKVYLIETGTFIFLTVNSQSNEHLRQCTNTKG